MGSSGIEALNFDIFICLVTHLDAVDVVALSKTNKSLRDLSLAHQTWLELGRSLISKGIPLPTNGFKTPDDLSAAELIESVLKADRVYRGWTSRRVRATKMTIINKDNCPISQTSGEITRILPVTSDIVFMVLGHVKLIFWDVVRGIRLAEYPRQARERLFPSAELVYDIDLKNKTFHFFTHTRVEVEGHEIHQAKLIKADFARVATGETGSKAPVSFEEVASYRPFGRYPGFATRIHLHQSFILDGRERRLCQVYSEKTILLFLVWDWSKPETAFIDTGLPRFARTNPSSGGVSLHQTFVCTWDAQNEQLILTLDTAQGIIHQHVYRASQFTPFLSSSNVLSPKAHGAGAIPLLPPCQSNFITYGNEKPMHTLASPAINKTAFRTPWHEFSGTTAPSPCSRPFLAHGNSKLERLRPAPLRGHVYLDFPPPTSGGAVPTTYKAPFVLAKDGPSTYMGTRSKTHCVRYGALAWAKDDDPDGSGVTRSIRICRFSYPGAGGIQSQQDDVEVCGPLLMDGNPVQTDLDGDSRLVSLSLDDVHGRLFLVYHTGKIVCLHFD